MRSAANRLFPAWLAALGLLACSPPEPQRYDSEFLAMGTRVQLAVLASSAAQAAQWSAHIQRELQRQGIDWYPWTTADSGELKQLNAALAAGKSTAVSPALLLLLQRAREISARSDGYFDPAVKPLTQAWGFADLATSQPAIPDAGLLAQWRTRHPSIAALRIDGHQVSSARTDLQLDLGAIAKGYAMQLALQSLRTLGCDNAMLNMGGQPGVMGEAMARAMAGIAIHAPRGDSAIAELRLKAGESISTSGDYQRFAMLGQQRIHHLFDPHTGMPVTHTQAVTVVSADATLADAASTALMAAGPADWQRIARQLGIREVLRIDATGAIEVSTALYPRLTWNPAIPWQRITQITL